MRSLLRFVALACLVASSSLFAQTTCDQLNSAIESSLKDLSFYSYSGLFDNSAPRSTDRKMDLAIQMDLIQANLNLLAANKCPVPKQPITTNAYAKAVSDCMNADPAKRAAACDRASWVRDK